MAFPEQITTFTRATDPSTMTDVTNIATYQEFIARGDFAGAAAYLTNTWTDGIKMQLNAGRLNEVLTVIEQIETFYKGLNGVKAYIQSNIDKFSDIAVWVGDVNYTVGQIVSNGNSLFTCIATNNTNIQPGVTSGWETYWTYFVKHQKQYPIQATAPTDQLPGDIWFKLQ